MCNFRQPPRPRSPRPANGRGRSSRSPSRDRARGAGPSITPGYRSPTANTCAACARRAKRKRRLSSMLTTFRDLGALPGASRAEVEMRAADDRSVVVGGPADATTLTPQELKIVRLAADGLTNKQIGRRLYLSPRIIDNHLHHAFPELGITSHINLRDALNSPIASDTPHHTPGAVRQCLGNPAPAEGGDAAGHRT
uniref:HTH luxR-type domain-containing protein n=1 Tax=Streptomyces spiroverticillatus TaxID=67366 RepID=C0SMY1_9ACTN|nr:hypothetical protein [Streptomyces spiroverticillatus]